MSLVPRTHFHPSLLSAVSSRPTHGCISLRVALAETLYGLGPIGGASMVTLRVPVGTSTDCPVCVVESV